MILITAMMAAAFLDLNLRRLHVWAVMAGYGRAMMGIIDMMAYV